MRRFPLSPTIRSIEVIDASIDIGLDSPEEDDDGIRGTTAGHGCNALSSSEKLRLDDTDPFFPYFRRRKSELKGSRPMNENHFEFASCVINQSGRTIFLFSDSKNKDQSKKRRVSKFPIMVSF